MKGRFFLSDEGFGHIVRQSAIITELLKIDSSLNLKVETSRHFEIAQKVIYGVEFEERFNNITWFKLPDGSPDMNKIRAYFAEYPSRVAEYMKSLNPNESSDFIVSDFVYESFDYAQSQGTPAFGVAHFTWDWFFSKLYPPVVSTELIRSFIRSAETAKRLYFPPFTPEEILQHFKHNAVQVPLIVRKREVSIEKSQNEFRVLIIDSGAAVLKQSIERALKQLKDIPEVVFYLTESLSIEGENVRTIGNDELLVDYIGKMNLVIGRAGFNTISECIAYRTPMLLLGESFNPEMNENILNLKRAGLGSFISLSAFENNLESSLKSFLDSEYALLNDNMQAHTMETDGAKIVAEDIYDIVSK